MKIATIGALLIALVACGNNAESVPIKDIDVGWTKTTDPYGREHACLVIDTGSYAGGLYCVPAP